MIVPMKKIYVVVQTKDITQALESLRELGSVHVEHQEPLTGFQLEERREEVEILENAIAILRSVKVKESIGQKEAADWTETVNTILELSAEAGHYKESVAKRQILISRWEPWGDFDLQAIRDLASRGVYTQLCAVAKDKGNNVPKGIVLETIFSSSGTDYCLAISEKEMDLPFEKIAFPEAGLKEMIDLQSEEQAKVSRAEDKIKQHLCYLKSLDRTLLERKDVLSFEEVERGMRAEGELALLKGYCPSNACDAIAAKTKHEQWGLLMEDPSPEDQVPTLLRNPKWARLIEPIYNMMNIIPGYRELDISPFFLIFFSIFFGMLVGDAGYGLIFLLMTLAAHWKLGKTMPNKAFLYLTYVLSTVTIIWGLLTGTVFGTLLFGQFFKPILPWLTEFRNVQMLCFALGAGHLTISHGWRFINKIPKPMGMLSEIGWITLLWVAFFLAKMLILGDPFSMLPVYLAAGAVLIIMADIIAQKQDIGVNLFLLFFSVIGVFTDVVSYIRLFAVGLAGVSIADAFNQIALKIGFHNILQAILASLVLIFVHLFLNLILAVLGVLVHGLRLNILEFSTHLNLEWTGMKYEPFKSLERA
ncbi:MAG: hypothetical protein A3C36_01155 [Omnitrophica WOR_2 bacterium RIFCSPHIGHO2_02_FULL_52_10]|nr:MAG: hypothetical protein A3C36_01155 [Omnitrophica WOR_2 bacterium RIFCSPHIGHO2_02_FULL_52_10]